LIYGSIGMNSGGFLYDRKIVEYLHSQGHVVNVISLPWLDYAEALAEYRKTGARITAELSSEKYDIIMQDELAHPLLSLLNFRIRKLGIPLISIVHNLRCRGEQPFGQKLRAAVFEAIYLAGVDGLVLNSRATLQAVRNLGAAAGKSFIISAPGCDRFSNFFDAGMVSKKCASPGPLKVLFAGNIIPCKGLHTLIAAVRQMPAGSWTLSVAGDPSFNPEYAVQVRADAEASGPASQIEFLGHLNDSEFARLLMDSHVLTVPSSYEGFGIVYAEAMGFGLPAIGCSRGAAPELIEHGRNGFLVEPGDHSGLARHLLYLQNNRGALLKMSLAARDSFLELPGWNEGLSRISGFLQELV